VKKILVAAFAVTMTVVVPGAAFAEQLPGRRPPCSIIRKSPLEASVGTALCEHPASNPTPAR
jgi:hypothetical protein